MKILFEKKSITNLLFPCFWIITMFLIYSVLNGVTLSTLGFAYGLDLVVIAFASTVVLFTVLAIYGYCTKEDLTKYTSLLTVGIISLIIMSLINIFLRSDGLMLITSIIGVIVFIIFMQCKKMLQYLIKLKYTVHYNYT